MLINQIGDIDETDPNAAFLLNEVLESLKFKNDKAQQADGKISEFMQPDQNKIKEVLDKEQEVHRKLNYSAVMPVDESG